MLKRQFENSEIQKIYETEYAKEIAKVDAKQEESINKSTMGYILFAALVFGAGYYIFLRFF